MANAQTEVNPKQDIPLGLIIVDSKRNSRKTMDETKLEELADTMKREGQLSPIRVEQVPAGEKNAGKYVLNFGYRRYAAATLLKWETIRCEVVTPMEPVKAKLSNVAENMAREDLTTYDQAAAFYDLHTEDGMKGTAIANSIGKSTPYVNNLIRAYSETEPVIHKRWKSECEPTFGKDKEGKKIAGAMKVCTLDWLLSVCKVPRADQEHELNKALGLVEEETDEEGDGEGGETRGNSDAPKRASMAQLTKALDAAELKLKETKDMTYEDEAEKKEDLATFKGVIMALKLAVGKNRSIKNVYTIPAPTEKE